MITTTRKRWAIWAVWIGLLPIFALSAFAGFNIAWGVAPMVLVVGVVVFPLLWLFAAHRLYARTEIWVPKPLMGLHVCLLLLGLAICVLLTYAAVQVAQGPYQTDRAWLINLVPMIILLALVCCAWIGHLAIFIDRMRWCKRTEEVFS